VLERLHISSYDLVVNYEDMKLQLSITRVAGTVLNGIQQRTKSAKKVLSLGLHL